MINETNTNNALAALQGTPDTKDTGRSSADMGQQDFIALMLAQMKNQDPTKPLDPNDFMSQLAQYSTVNGIQELKQSFDSMAAMLSTDQSLKATGMVGHDVMTPGNAAVLEEGGNVAGQVLLDSSVTDLNIKIYDPQGSLIRTIPMGGQGAGVAKFKWDGFGEDGNPALPGNYKLVAEVEVDGNVQEAAMEIRSRVESVSLSPYGGILLNLNNGDSISLDAIQTIM
ncbi:flagellar hook assembly protein FlgD [Thiolapillus sp.]